MQEPVFELTEEKQTWLVRDSEDHGILLTRYSTGKVDVVPFVPNDTRFCFKGSDPNIVLAIGRLLVAAARKVGATDA